MIGKLMEYVSLSALWAGFAFALCALMIVFWRAWQPLNEKELLQIVAEYTTTWKEKSKGWLRVPALAALLPFLLLMLVSSLVPTLYPYVEPHPLIHSEGWYIIPVTWEQPNQELWVRRKDGIEAKVTFCKSFDPPFREGEYLDSIDFRNYIGCIFPEHYVGAHDPSNPSVHATFNCPTVGAKAAYDLDPHCNLPRR